MQALTGLSGLSGLIPAGGPTTLLKDNFIDANGTALTAHTMNTGPGWTLLEGTVYTIQSNSASGAQATDHAIADATNATVTITVTVTFSASNLTNTFRSGFSTRVVSSLTYWMVDKAGLDGGVRILTKQVGIGFTVRATYAAPSPTAGQAYVLKGVWSGDTLTVTQDGANAISYTSNLNSTATKQGVRVDTDGTNALISNTFLVTNP